MSELTVGEFLRTATKERLAAAEAAKAEAAKTAATATTVVKPPETTSTEGKGAAIVLKATSIVNEEHGTIIGIGSLADAVDLDNDSVPADVMVKAAHDFTGRDKRTFKANHSESVNASLAESWIGVPVLDAAVDGVTHTDAHGMHRLTKGQHIPDDRTVVATAFKASDDDAQAWFVGIKPSDPALVEAARKKEIAGFSWGGSASRTPA